MQILKPILFLLPCTLLACATDPAVEDLTTDEPPPSQPIAACALPHTPPVYNLLWTLSDTNSTASTLVGNYGTSECSSYVIAVRNVETISAAAFLAADTPAKCTGTGISMLKYTNESGSWVYAGSISDSGIWTINGCQMPEVKWTPDTTHEARVDLRANRTTCSGQLCGTTHGIPFAASAHVYLPPPGPN